MRFKKTLIFGSIVGYIFSIDYLMYRSNLHKWNLFYRKIGTKFAEDVVKMDSEWAFGYLYNHKVDNMKKLLGLEDLTFKNESNFVVIPRSKEDFVKKFEKTLKDPEYT